MIRTIAILTGLASATPVLAQDIRLTPLADARLRYETVDQDGLATQADAVTLRVRSGVEAASGPWSMLAEAQGNLAIVGDYFDGLNGTATRPLVADPQNVGLYRAQIQYRTKALTLTAGRQRIGIDDERFVGAIGFRQNGQTFDAVRAEWHGVPGLQVDLAYAWSVRTIWGIDGNGTRQQAVSGDNLLATVGYATPIGTLTGFAYAVDQDEAAVQGYRLSSQTYGARLVGTRPLGKAKLAYRASYARQSDWHRNPNDYAANYYIVDAAIDLNGPKLGVGYEVLGAARGAVRAAFQTPLGTNFKFQGWADKFLTTPADGVRDAYGSAGYGWKTAGPLTALSVQAVYHRFDSDRLVRRYGEEIDLIASAKLKRTLVTLRYADYRADRLATDTRKVWLQLDWTI